MKQKLIPALASVISLLIPVSVLAQSSRKIELCANSISYDQPNSYYANRVGTFGSQFPVDLVLRFTDKQGVKWVQVKWFNGFPSQAGSGWKFGWVRQSDICKS